MKPSTQQNCLKRFLKLQPLTGWPIWPAQYNPTGKYSLREHTEHEASRWYLHGIRGREHVWKRLGQLEAHESLCIIQDHLLWYLAERGPYDIEYLPSGTRMVIVSREYSGDGPSLIEALLDVAEQIQKETSDA